MMIRALCDGLASGRVKAKMVDLPGVPRVGEQLEVEALAGMVVLIVTHVRWSVSRPVTVAFRPGPLGQTSLGDIILDQDGWEPG